MYNSNGTAINNLAIYRSDSGALLCAGPFDLVPTNKVYGDSDGTKVFIKIGVNQIIGSS